jgi:DNA-binding transcriptional ArsR family regulator
MTRTDAVFAALADATRREVLTLVAERGPASATTLGQALPVSRQAVVKHLAILRSAGLVAAQRQGQEVQYQLVPAAFAEASEWIAHLGARWDARLTRLSAFLALEPRPLK